MKRSASPFSKLECLQTVGADFKRRGRHARRHCTDELDEWRLQPCYFRGNRLQGLAITNKHGGVKVRPILEAEEEAAISIGILVTTGNNRTAHKKARDEGRVESTKDL